MGPGQSAGRGVACFVTWQDAPAPFPTPPLDLNQLHSDRGDLLLLQTVSVEPVSRPAVYFSISTCRRRPKKYLICAGSELQIFGLFNLTAEGSVILFAV